MRKPEAAPFRWIYFAWASPPIFWVLAWAHRLLPDVMQEVPWYDVAIWVTIFCAGVLVADISNPMSPLRRWFRWRFRFFDVEDIPPVRRTIDQTEYLFVTLKIRFVRDAKQASLLMDVQGCMEPKGGSARLPSSLIYERTRTFLKGENSEFVVATVPIKNYSKEPLAQAKFGPIDLERPPPLVPGSVNILTIALTSGWQSQHYKIYLRNIMISDSAAGRVFYMGEDYDAFGTTAGPAYS